MARKHRPHPGAEEARPAGSTTDEGAPAAPGEQAVSPDAPGEAEAAGGTVSGTALVEPVEQGVERLQRELDDMRDRYLRSAAEVENVKKRAARDKAELWSRAQADLLATVLDVIDDLARVAHLDPAQTSSEALHEGVGLVEKKFLKVLEGAGLQRIDPTGQVFDPNLHEAVTTVPAPAPEVDGTVGMVFQHGYRFSGALIRPARVAVYAWTEPPPSEVVN